MMKNTAVKMKKEVNLILMMITMMIIIIIIEINVLIILQNLKNE
jgi:hypothetical protein